MADPITLTLSGGNKATKKYLKYYNEIIGQLMQNPYTISAQTIANPQEMVAQQIAAPEKIAAERIDVGQHSYDEFAGEAANYLSRYLDNSIASRRRQTADARAASDVDAYSRGMGASTWLSDAKNRLAMNEAADITAMQNNYLGQVGEQAFNAYQNYLNRDLQAQTQNAANALAAAQANAAYEQAVAQYNADALMNADRYNIDNALRVAMQNAQNQWDTDVFNAQLYEQLQQMAWQYAGQMYGMKSSGGRGGASQSGVTQTPEQTAPTGAAAGIAAGITAPQITAPKVVSSEEPRHYNAAAPSTRNYDRMVPMAQ